MTLSTMSNNILRFCPGLNLDLIKSNIQDSYRYLCSRDWNRLKVTAQISTTPIYADGTISIDAGGVVTGSGTNFSPTMVGSFLKVHLEDSFFTIQTYASSTSLTLADWPGRSISNSKYSIFKTIYTLPPSLKIVWDVIHQIPLRKRPQSFFNSIDPPRSATSPSPIAWALAGVTPTGSIQIEIYPVPTNIATLRVYGKRSYSPLADDDTPLLPEDLIEAHALLSCYRMKDLKEPGQGWADKLALQAEFYTKLLTDYEEEDHLLGEHSNRVQDMMGEPFYPYSDNFALSHDVD